MVKLPTLIASQNPVGLFEIEKAMVKILSSKKEKGTNISLTKNLPEMPAFMIIPPAIKANTISGVITVGDVRQTTKVIIAKINFSAG
ncbi:hypothetical protein SPFL3101_02835 [Sporomusaceae bacterium FL31]|nr:hypothetical protein SPFL3101_02835 [Sporomusaceae bacterium FL31]